MHTIDILALETVRRLFWCNPFFFLILRELKLVHEFLADRHAIESAPDRSGSQRSAYAEWLVWQSQGVPGIPQLAHSFYHPQLQRRIAMLLHPTPQRAGRAVRWLSLPLILLLVPAFATRGIGHVGMRVPTEYGPIRRDDRLSRFFLRHLQYPEEALKQGMTDSVWFFVKMDASGHKVGGGGGTGEIDTRDKRVMVLSVTAPALNAQQKIAEPVDGRSKTIFVQEADKVASLLFGEDAVSVPPGSYYFSLTFKIEKP